MTTSAANRPWLKTYETLGLDWATVPDVPEASLANYVEAHARHFGDRTALVYLGHTISYRELDSLGNRFANMLLSLGCRQGDVLGIHLPNTPQYILGFIAAAKLNMVVTSISPLLAPPEFEHQANDAQIKVLLTLDALYEKSVLPLSGKIPSLSTVLVSRASDFLPSLTASQWQPQALGKVPAHAITDLMEHASEAVVSSTPVLDEVLFLQYTGGTTGKPKAACLTLRNIVVNNLQIDVLTKYRLGQETVASAFPLFHIGGTAVMYNAIRMAATFLLIPDPRNVEHFCAEMQAHPPTVLANVPALFQMLLNCPAFHTMKFSSLRLALAGAAPSAPDEIARLEAVIGKGKMCELYGMTETGPIQTCNPAPRFKSGCVGIPLPGTDIRIVDTETGLKEMALGEAGEIIVRGPQVMRGYLGAADATKNALREFDGEIWMYTGDIGIIDDEGYVKICDRSKDMLIIGGYKVFSVEVESKLQALPFIALTAVVGRPDLARPGNDVAQLYVQLKPDAGECEAALTEKITEFCRVNMAAYKVPKEVFFIEAIPLTAIGKIDKKALRQRDGNNTNMQLSVSGQ
jgi:long-chain acyl-CoA synthetase